MKYLLSIFVLILLQISVFAHKGGHNNEKTWMINKQPVKAELLKYEDGKVYLLNQEHQLLTYDLKALSPKEQKMVLQKHNQILHLNENKVKKSISVSKILSGLGAFLLIASILLFLKHKRNYYLIYALLGCIFITISACSDSNDKESEDDDSIETSVPANNISFLQSVFGNFSGVTTSYDDTYFYISSNGIPDHNMMVGITSWQQQVPINHAYTGDNSWAIPIQPVLAENPLSMENNLLKGAIAIAANGIPIFNPRNNRGEFAYEIGELDQWGGHSGRADDYHYHIPPTHLQEIVGEGNPIAYAVDGFPVYGETTEELDEYLGKLNEDGSYQYHTISEAPYFIAGMRGEVTLDPTTEAPENQVIPQAFTSGVRTEEYGPLEGAEITGFESTGTNSYSLTYEINGETYYVNYSWDENGLYTFEYLSPDGTSITNEFQRQN